MNIIYYIFNIELYRRRRDQATKVERNQAAVFDVCPLFVCMSKMPST